MTENTALQTLNKQVMKVYAAQTYTELYTTKHYDHITTIKIKINLPEYSPTTPKGSGTEQIGLSGNLFKNNNFPKTGGTVKMNHCLELPLLRGSDFPKTINMGDALLLIMPTNKPEEGYLIYI